MATISLYKRAQMSANIKVQIALECLVNQLDRHNLLPSRIDILRQQQAPCPEPRPKDVNLLNVTEAAASLALSPKTLANWRVSGGGPRFCKIGGRIAYRKADLQAFLEANLKVSTSDIGKGGSHE